MLDNQMDNQSSSQLEIGSSIQSTTLQYVSWTILGSIIFGVCFTTLFIVSIILTSRLNLNSDPFGVPIVVIWVISAGILTTLVSWYRRKRNLSKRWMYTIISLGCVLGSALAIALMFSMLIVGLSHFKFPDNFGRINT